MTDSADEGPLLYAVGDIAPDRDDPRECFALVRDVAHRIEEEAVFH